MACLPIPAIIFFEISFFIYFIRTSQNFKLWVLTSSTLRLLMDIRMDRPVTAQPYPLALPGLALLCQPKWPLQALSYVMLRELGVEKQCLQVQGVDMIRNQVVSSLSKKIQNRIS